jgi:RNA polymerase sigma factor (sigma-70 family)
MTSTEFKQQVFPLGKKLFHFARLLLNSEAEAQDAVQETYLKLWKIKDRLAALNNIEAFAMKMTKNWCLDRLKAKKPLLIDSYTGEFDPEPDSNNPHTVLETTDKMNRFFNMMKLLPEQQQVIIQLRDVEGYEFEEIAEMTNMNLSAIRVNLSRARKKLRESLIKMENYGPEKDRNTASEIL